MKFSAISMLALPLMAIASPFALERRANQFTTLQKNLTQLAADIVAENKTLNSFGNSASPSINQEIALANGANAIAADINSTTNVAKSSSTLTAAQSTTIFNYLNTTLYPDVSSTLKNFIAHYPGLKTAGLVSTVHTILGQQKNATDGLATALTAISAGSAKTNAPALQKKFDTAFNAAIAKFAS